MTSETSMKDTHHWHGVLEGSEGLGLVICYIISTNNRGVAVNISHMKL
jgi:hypothetical protein